MRNFHMVGVYFVFWQVCFICCSVCSLWLCVLVRVAMLVDRGLLDYRDKVTKHWPEFDDGRQQGKGEAWRE